VQVSSRIRTIEILDDRMAAVLRSKTGAERLRMARDMVAAARRMLESHLGSQHPDWDPQKVRREAARRLSHGAG
jgi:hypothetical protein